MFPLAGVGRGVRVVFCFFAGLCFQSQASNLFVSSLGSDDNSGSSSQPFRTISHAYSLALPGDRILVQPGVYSDYSSNWGLHLGANGTASSPIVLKSLVKGGAVIDGLNASDRNQGIYLDGSYNVVDGFEIRNGPNGGILVSGNNNQILNCEIHNNGNPASTNTDGMDGVYSDSSSSGNIYFANSIHHNGRIGSSFDHGLYLCGKNESVINNVVYGNAASGLQVAGYTTVSNIKVYNNVLAFNGTSGIILWQSLNEVDIKNNIFYQNGHYGVGSYDAHGGGVVLDHNLAYGNGYGGYNLSGDGSDYSYTQGTAVSGAPVLANVNPAGFDAHLSDGSPGIAAGVNLSSVFTTDKDGAPWPALGNWNLGPYVASKPRLSLVVSAGIIIISWPAGSGGYQLESKSIPSVSSPWTAVTSVPMLVGSTYEVREPAVLGGKLYRLRSQ
ncbi:MAG TPA: right-handed parallel beta-helix repeat-containing protein [Candidatus Limnocylindrales bacterium]|nr:right-handed parallel beta-helix repeat-containing protein [Candidatus Limnocylindrales bacterium]